MTQEQNTPSPEDMFDAMARSYDERNRPLEPIKDALHILMSLVLKDLPKNARILCVGIGTGADILALAHARPGWSFVGVDPSHEMLNVCRERLERDGLMARCELVQGYVEDVPADTGYDAVVSLFVAHFVQRQDRPGFYRHIQERLKPGGYLVSAEISYDLDAAEFSLMLKNWEQVQSLMGATPEAIASLPDVLRNTLCVLSPAETEQLIRTSGLTMPVQFFQAFMISGWYAWKEVI